MKSLILLLRPQQWLKNFFIFLPLFFDGHLLELDYLLPTLLVFIAFCLTASSIYCFNDIWDIEMDRQHPLKSKRPVASGRVSKSQAYLMMSFLLLISLGTLFFFLDEAVRWNVIAIMLCYYIMNLAYCIKLKQVAIVDVFIIAIGFILRVIIGGEVTSIFISQWIILMTFLLALFLAFAKRRDDLIIYLDKNIKMRKSIGYYNLEFMNQVISIIASIIMVCYIMYTVSEDVCLRFGTSYLYITSIFVLAGIIRYLQLTIVDIKSGSPTKVLVKDRFIQICLLCWIVVFLFIIYF